MGQKKTTIQTGTWSPTWGYSLEASASMAQYPTNDTNFTEYVYPLSNVSYMEAPVFCYNEDTKLYLTTFISFSGVSQQVNLINYKINA